LRDADDFKNAIVFCNRKRDVAILQRSLSKHGFNAGALHGDMDQRARMQTLDDFRTDKLKILVASDVAARGLDIPAVSHVFNFDVPTHAEDYVHRIGRTGRAGRSGTAITIATPIDTKYVAAIEKLTGQPIEEVEVECSTERAASFGRGRAEREQRKRESASDERKRDKNRERRGSTDRSVDAGDASPPSGDTSRRKQPKDRRREKDDKPVIGFGDYIPNFLLRPVRVPSS
jgi:superfamily II DNA/RNA helicase